MTLFLASSMDETIGLILDRLPKLPSECRVVFVANAADPFGNKQWVEMDRAAFVNNNFRVADVDLSNISQYEFVKILETADILHFGGGSIIYLLSLIKRKNLLTVIRDFVIKKGLIYTGTSAGSVIAASSVKLYSFDKEEEKFAEGVSDFNGLGLVDILIIPHSNNREFNESNINIITHLSENKIPVVMLYDNQLLAIQDNKVEILSN